MGEKSREYFAVWLTNHRPTFVVIHTENSTNFFQQPMSLTLKRQGKGYAFSVRTDKELCELELDIEFNAFCSDKYTENSITIMDMKSSVEVIEKYQRNGF